MPPNCDNCIHGPLKKCGSSEEDLKRWVDCNEIPGSQFEPLKEVKEDE
jgi:hypothetical protein